MRQRMRLAAALVHNPEVLLLDEPLSGTDPRQRLEFQRIVRRLSSEGRTIVISSHILEEVEVMAREIVLMVSGKVAASGDFRAIRRAMSERPYLVRVGCSDTRRPCSMSGELRHLRRRHNEIERAHTREYMPRLFLILRSRRGSCHGERPGLFEGGYSPCRGQV